MEFKIITAKNPGELNSKINDYISHGWEVVGAHQVVITHPQNVFNGGQHHRTENQIEYSISVVKKLLTTPELL